MHSESTEHRDEVERRRKAADSAAGRLFRAYEKHCKSPGADTLFHFLTAMHSLSDRLSNATHRDFHEIEEFIALKALRNFAHHQEEISANVRVIRVPAVTDLAFLCIVRRDQVERAIESAPKQWRASTRAACDAKFHWYGQAVNINPCLFNFTVRAYELLLEVDVLPPKEAIKAFESSYRSEEEQGLSHLVDGRLVSRVAEIEVLLSAVVATMPKP